MSRTRWPDMRLETGLWQAGFEVVAGLDEAGRGAWAGPLVAAAVVLPRMADQLAASLAGVRDSKQMTPRQREHWDQRIRAVAVAVATGVASPAEIDERGPLGATRLAMSRALVELARRVDFLLIDHLRLPESELPQAGIPGGDSQVLSIAAASVVAKVTRDRMMVDLTHQYPGYRFDVHKGYGTRQHREALQRLGPCLIHRISYLPVASALAERRHRSTRLAAPQPAH